MRPIDQHASTFPVRHGNHLFNRIDGAEAIGHMGEGDELCSRGQELLVLVEQALPVVVNRHDAQHPARLLADDLPGDDVRVVFHRGDQDLVTLLQVRSRVALRDQVDALRGPAYEDHLFGSRGVEEVLHLTAGALIRPGRSNAQGVKSAVNVGVVRRIESAHRVDHGLRLLRRRGVVQIDQGFAVDRLRKDGEVLSYALDVQPKSIRLRVRVRAGVRGGNHTASPTSSPWGRRPRTSSSSNTRSGSGRTCAKLSRANAWISRSRATSAVIPRERR